jgi:hypothetical protein
MSHGSTYEPWFHSMTTRAVAEIAEAVGDIEAGAIEVPRAPRRRNWWRKVRKCVRGCKMPRCPSLNFGILVYANTCLLTWVALGFFASLLWAMYDDLDCGDRTLYTSIITTLVGYNLPAPSIALRRAKESK